MITSMSDMICITNRGLCRGDFLEQIKRLAKAHPRAIILREKDLSPENYRKLAAEVLDICREEETECILHTFADIAAELGAGSIHLPLHILREMPDELKKRFRRIGASCHSVEDAIEASSLGASYITAGHVFATDCKKGLPPRGIDFLKNVCGSVDIPIYAIGGISPENIAEVRRAGASGGCVMSSAMNCNDAVDFLRKFEEADHEI